MQATADVIEAAIVPFLQLGGVVLATLLAWLIAAHGVNAAAVRLRRRTAAVYRGWLARAHDQPGALAALARAATAARRRRILCEEMLAAAADPGRRDRLRAIASALGLLRTWRDDLDDRRWWVRADAARALGLLGDDESFDRLNALLTDADPDVRVAAIDGLGYSRDPRAIPALLDRLSDPSRRHRTRLVGALRMLGAAATPDLVAWIEQHADAAEALAGLFTGGDNDALAAALVARCGDADSRSRLVALRLLSRMRRPSPRVAQCALEALADPLAEVRALAARLLGLAGDAAAAGPLDARLDDEWEVAAESAVALRRLGAPGLARLHVRARETGQAADLARQMVSEARLGLPPAEVVA